MTDMQRVCPPIRPSRPIPSYTLPYESQKTQLPPSSMTLATHSLANSFLSRRSLSSGSSSTAWAFSKMIGTTAEPAGRWKW